MAKSVRDQEARALVDRLTRAKRVGLFGHRNVGKTTLLAMFYRQAAGGRLPGLRLAASNPRTAEYLADKIAALESGQATAGTLAETELALRLYHGPARLDLIVKDYQGEHVTLGSDAPILEFLADCDAVLLCLEAAGAVDPAERRRRQQELEGLLERYLEQSKSLLIDRPIALVLTKLDLAVGYVQGALPRAEWVEQVVESRYGMTRHALAAHAPEGAIFAVSAFGEGSAGGRPPESLRPIGLEAPLAWLAEELEARDRRDLERLFEIAGGDLGAIERALEAYEHRYPRSNRSHEFKARLGGLTRGRRRRFAAATIAAAGLAACALAGYDRIAFEQARAFENQDPAPALAERRWGSFIEWHPTLGVFWPKLEAAAREKQALWRVRLAQAQVKNGAEPADLPQTLERLKDESPALIGEIRQVEAARNESRHDTRWRETQGAARSLAALDDPAVGLSAIDQFLREFPDSSRRAQALELAQTLKAEQQARARARDQHEAEELIRAESAPGATLDDLIVRARKFLDDHADSPAREIVSARLGSYLSRKDDADYENAIALSRQSPQKYRGRIEQYDLYLKAHANGGRHTSEAMEARNRILEEWDHDSYKAAYAHSQAHPEDPATTAKRVREYLRDHPDGRRAEAAKAYLDWWDKVSVPRSYRVTLKRGEVEPTVGKYLAGGAPDLGVVIEVAGQVYGPSSVIRDSHKPVWDYTFPDPIIWKLGDPVTIRIIDYDWTATEVYRLTSPAGDPLAIRLLSNAIKPTKGGKTSLVFASEYTQAELPAPE